MTDALAPALHTSVMEYVARLNTAVGSLPHAEATDIVREIQTHINDKLAGDASDAAVERVLASLGSPEALAENFRLELLLTRASRSFSPWLLLRTTGRWARSGVKGFAVFMIALFGYSMGLGLTVTLLMKPFFPSVGLWVGSGNFTFGMPGNTAHMHELLGQAYVPVTTVLAFVVVFGTTRALQSLIRKRIPKRTY